MGNRELDNLVKIGQLKIEPFAQSEFDTYMRSGRERLQDAPSPGLSISGKFLLEVTEDLTGQVIRCAKALEKML